MRYSGYACGRSGWAVGETGESKKEMWGCKDRVREMKRAMKDRYKGSRSGENKSKREMRTS